jgi:PAS domain S-box-containing protein
MVAIMVLLIILTALAISIPTIWLIRTQLDQRSVAIIKQGSDTTAALILARQNNLATLATLTAQRPSLLRLFQDQDAQSLADYLQTLQEGAALDLVALCSKDTLIAQAGAEAPDALCAQPFSSAILQLPDGREPPAWMLAAQAVPGTDADVKVVVGTALDDAFARHLRDQTGLEQALFYQGRFLGSSVDQPIQSALTAGLRPLPEIGETGYYTLDGTPYIIVRSAQADSGLENLVLLSELDAQRTEAQLTAMIVGGMLLIILFGSALGFLLAKRISLPLERLRDSAISLRMGNLTSPVMVRTKVREVAQVGYALEDARVALQHSLSALRQERDWINNLLESVMEGLMALDPQGRITYFSPGAERITGWKQAQVLGRPVDDVFLLPDENESFSRSLPERGGKQTILSIQLNGRLATLAIASARLAPPEAGRASTALLLRDISDEEALRRLLGGFLANITHEFRTPLSALAASSELLMDQLPSLSTAELQELLNALHLGIIDLQTLIDNLLEGASIEAGRFRVQPHPASLEEIITSSYKTMQPLLDKYHQRLVMDVPDNLPEVLADPRRTAQAIVNLLSNAIKWSPTGSEIRLSAESLEGELRLSVGDQGPGVPDEKKAEVFNRFAHLVSSNQRAEYGAGIGLSVVKAIVEAQCGSVGVQDRPGGGSIFWFTLPIAEPETQEEGLPE